MESENEENFEDEENEGEFALDNNFPEQDSLNSNQMQHDKDNNLLNGKNSKYEIEGDSDKEDQLIDQNYVDYAQAEQDYEEYKKNLKRKTGQNQEINSNKKEKASEKSKKDKGKLLDKNKEKEEIEIISKYIKQGNQELNLNLKDKLNINPKTTTEKQSINSNFALNEMKKDKQTSTFQKKEENTAEKSKIQKKSNEITLNKEKEKKMALNKKGMQLETNEETEMNPIEMFRSSTQSFYDEMKKIGEGININLDQYSFDPITKNRCLEYALGSIVESPTRATFNTLNSSKGHLILSKGKEIPSNQQNLGLNSKKLMESNNAGFSGSKDIGNEFEDNLKQRLSGIGIRKVYYQPAQVGTKLEKDYLSQKELIYNSYKSKDKKESDSKYLKKYY